MPRPSAPHPAAMHKLASLRGAPNLHAQIVQSPEFFKLKKLIRE